MGEVPIGADQAPPEPMLPDYGGACVANVVPALLEPGEQQPSWMPPEAMQATRVVLLVLDGLGYEQLAKRRHIAPTLSAMVGGPITSVAPSTTSTALTSIATGLSPGEHGVIGYRMAVEGEVLNVLRWSLDGRDGRKRVPPEQIQPTEAFCAQRPAIVTRAEFRRSGFTRAHLEGARFNGYRTLSTLVVEIARLLRQDHEPFIYAYYDGLDKVGHEYGLGEHYEAELAAIDTLVAEIAGRMPRDSALVVTADHGQVEVGDRVVNLHPSLTRHCTMQSGEGRFRWLHARPGRLNALEQAAREHHSDTGWVVTANEAIDQGWFGPTVTNAARTRLGDVALVAHQDVSYFDAADTGPFELVGRHGSLTPAEMQVPLLVAST